jgi:hypothetical protein
MDATHGLAAILRDARKGALLRMRSEIYSQALTPDVQGFYDRRYHRIELFEFLKAFIKKRPAAGKFQPPGALIKMRVPER